jgi:uncharacterized protein (UPF0548 family)
VSEPFTYPEVGATRGETLPAGYRHADVDVLIGHGPECFERAAEGLLTWRMHRAAGFRVTATADRAAAGVQITSRLPLVRVPCRVVYVIDDDGERGFGYGTLPGHPVRGEESFVIRLTGAGEVRFRIRSFSRPATLPARLATPATHLAQRLFTTRYTRALHRLATHPPQW